MSPFKDAVRVLGEERVAEIRACAAEVLRMVLADRERFARRIAAKAAAGRAA